MMDRAFSCLTLTDLIRSFLVTRQYATRREIVEHLDQDPKNISNVLGTMVQRGELEKAGYGVYKVVNLKGTFYV